MKAKFLNVDLEITSSTRPFALEKELVGLGALNLFSGDTGDGYLCTFEVAQDMDTPDQVVIEFSRLIGGFKKEAKKEWDDASERVFDVGYESIHSIQNTLKGETVRIIEGLGGLTRYTTRPPTVANKSAQVNPCNPPGNPRTT